MFTDWGADEWKEFAFGWGCVIASFLCFRLCQFVVRWYLFGKCTFRTFSYFGLRAKQRKNDSRELTVVPPNKKWRISNEAVSLIHSVISGLWAAYSLLVFRDLVHDMVNARNDVAIYLIYMSSGYLLHDLVDLLTNEKSARIIELLFHHAVVLTGFAVTMLTQKYLGVVIFGLLMELNSMFLHSRSLLNLYGVDKKSTSFRMVALLNMISMILFRLAVSLYLAYWAIMHVANMVWYHIIPTVLVIASLCTTNSVLAYRIMAADGLLGKKRARKSPAGTTSTAVTEGGEGEGQEDEDVDDEEVLQDEDAPHTVAVQVPEITSDNQNLMGESIATTTTTQSIA